MTPDQHTALDQLESAIKALNKVILIASQVGVSVDMDVSTKDGGYPQIRASYEFGDYTPTAPKRVFE